MRWILTPLVCVCLTVGVASAQAQQSRPERPYRGLFASDLVADAEQQVSVSSSFGTGWDSDLAQEARDSGIVNETSGSPQSGGLGHFSGSLSYGLSTERVRLSAGAGSSGRYYPTAEITKMVHRENVNAQGSAQLGGGFAVNGSAGYQPFTTASLYGTFFTPQLGEPSPDLDYGTSREHFVSYSAGLSWSTNISRRTSLNASYRYAGRAVTADVPGYSSYDAGGGLKHDLSRGLALNLGYRYNESRYASGDPYRNHMINAGVDFDRSLSFSRRTTLSFSTGTMAMDDPATDEGMQFRAIGDASLTHEIGRTWSATAAYNRSLRFTEDWLQPIASDSVALTLGGLVNRRFSVHVRGGASTGQVGTGDEGGFDTYFADAGVNFAIGRHASFGVSYRYHDYDFAQSGQGLEFGVPPSVRRHSVQAYISLSALVYQRARRP